MVDAAIDELISLKPHLSDPLRFYARTVRFYEAIRELRLPVFHASSIYPADRVAEVMDRYTAALELPQGSLLPLQQAFEVGEIDVTRLPRCETPAFSLPYAEDDLLLLLYIISRPYFLGLRERSNQDDRQWDKGMCPLCGGKPSLSSIGRDGRRTVYCSFCGTSGYVPRDSCPACLTTDREQLDLLTYQGEEGFSIQVCEACRSYGKIVHEEQFADLTPDLADLTSLPLDFVVQQQGYSRRSPNPIGMLRMSVSG